MTYDPLSYGQIKLKDKTSKPGETPDDILFDDAGPAPQMDTAAHGDTDWELLDTDMDALRPGGEGMAPAQDFGQAPNDFGTGSNDFDAAAGDFGADVLGESMPMSAPAPMESDFEAAAPVEPSRIERNSPPMPASPRAPRPAPQRPMVAAMKPAAAAPVSGAPAPAATATAKRAPAAAGVARRPVERRRQKRKKRPSKFAGTLTPALIVAIGGSASGWFYMMEQNMVMAGMVGAISLVGAALSRVMFR